MQKEISAAGAAFEKQFLSTDLSKHILNCDHYELAPLFIKWLPDHQPILEAGSGSGRWVGWFTARGWKSTGLDWSEACCARARMLIPAASFVAGDMRNMPFENDSFASIVSLGSVEHSPEGPLSSLKEYHRVLKPGGIAIITVPYLSILRRFNRCITAPKNMLIRNSILRKLLGKSVVTRKMREARKDVMSGYAADYLITNLGMEFYQYHFTMSQMRSFIEKAGFSVIEEFVDFSNEGILHNFGRIAGKYDFEEGRVEFSVFGKILRRFIPVSMMGHMLCYLVKKTNK